MAYPENTSSQSVSEQMDRKMSSGDSGHDEIKATQEGPVARTIEKQTARLPSDTFLWAAMGSIVGSMTLQFLGKSKLSLFVGQWVPTFLLLGVYNKIVKVAGHDRATSGPDTVQPQTWQ